MSYQTLRSTGPDVSNKGFTLLELLVVSMLIAIMLTLSVPAFRTTLVTDELRKDARRVIGTIREARQAATGSRNGCFLDLDISESQLSYHCPGPPAESETESQEEKPKRTILLSSPVRISSIWSGPEENITSGTVSLWINRNGLMDQTIINLTDGDRDLALISSVFIAAIRLEDKSMSPQDLEER